LSTRAFNHGHEVFQFFCVFFDALDLTFDFLEVFLCSLTLPKVDIAFLLAPLC